MLTTMALPITSAPIDRQLPPCQAPDHIQRLRQANDGVLCYSLPPDMAEAMGAHWWQRTETAGCYRCTICHRLGACAPCYVAASGWLPRLTIPMRCALHEDAAKIEAAKDDAAEQPVGIVPRAVRSPGTVRSPAQRANGDGKDTERQTPAHVQETPVWGLAAARNWVALMERAEAVFAEVSVDQTTAPSQRPDLWRKVKTAFDSVYRYEHQLTPPTRRLARELAWRRAHPERLLPPYAPPDAAHPDANANEPSEPYAAHEAMRSPDRRRIALVDADADTMVYRRDWEHCQCRACQLDRQRDHQRDRQRDRRPRASAPPTSASLR